MGRPRNPANPPPPEKSPAELLREAQLEAQISELRAMGYSWRDIETELSTKNQPLSHETARKIHMKFLARTVKEDAKTQLKAHIAEEKIAYRMMIREAYKGWLRSVGEMEKTAIESGETAKGPIDKTTITSWIQAGDVNFLYAIDKFRDRINNMMGVYDKDRDKDDETIDTVRFLQEVYIPGLPQLTPELIAQLLKAVPPMPDDG